MKTDSTEKTYIIRKVKSLEGNDGNFLSADNWTNAIVLEDFRRPWEGADDIETEFRALYDEKNLYLRYKVADDNILVSKNTNDKQEVAKGDRVEIFFTSDDTLNKYYCLEVAPDGRVLDYSASHYRKFDMGWFWPKDHLFVKVGQKHGTYDCQITVSLESLRQLNLLKDKTLQAGIFRADCYSLPSGLTSDSKIGWVTWVDPKTERPDFHVPSSFGKLLLEQ